MTFQLAVAQFAPSKGRDSENFDQIADLVKQAKSEQADLVVFPESAVSGYFMEGGANEHAYSCDQIATEVGKRFNSSTPIDLMVGFYESSEVRPHNSVVHLEIGPEGCRAKQAYRKLFLPTYGVFDEARFHSSGSKLGLMETRFGKIGCLICEDVWHSILSTLLALQGAQLIVVPSASPARGFVEDKPGNLLRYERMLRALSEEHGVYSAASMLCGFEGGKGFAGGSFIFSPDGVKVAQAPIHEPALIMSVIDSESVALARRSTPLFEDLREMWPLLTQIVDSTEPHA